MTHQVLDQSFIMIHHKAIFWKNTASLLISDPHFGKVTHFRKHGIYVPEIIPKNDLTILESLFTQYKPLRLIILGDLFHSKFNKECDFFYALMKKFPSIKTLLIMGNHDILPQSIYKDMGIITEEEYSENGILFTHDPYIEISHRHDFDYHISGHLHPAFKIVGKANQRLTLPCFVFGNKQAIIPAFGSFKGQKGITAQSGDRIFVIANENIIPFDF